MKKSILFVDDELQILKALKRLFYKSEYECYFASSGKEALHLLESTTVDLVISDMRMPQMDGYETLSQIKKLYPKVLRVALSGFTENRKVYGTLENNVAKLYLFKPWNNEEFKGIIKRLFTLEDSLADKDLLELINNLDELPTLPTLYSELNRLVQEDASIDEISTKIEEDQSVASRILRVANSAFYGAKTGSIPQAIMYIGLTNVKNIVLSNAVFFNSSLNGELRDSMWEHVSLTNKLLPYFYKEVIGKKIDNNFAAAGLLHDIGRVILMSNFTDKYNDIYVRSKEDDTQPFFVMEEDSIGISHQKLGGYLLNWWEIPLPIVETAMYHHDPFNEAVINSELVCAVHVANYYASIMLDGFHPTPFDERILEFFSITKDALDNLFENFTED